MERPLDALERDLDALRAAWADSMPAFGAIAGAAQAEVEQMSDAGLVRVTDLLAQVRRDSEALLTRVAAEVAKRSGQEFGDTGLAKAQGFHSPARLIAASTGASHTDAAKLIAVGSATAERQTFGGERLPPRHPHVAPVVDDHRSIPQIQADAIAAIARHALGCAQTLAPLAKTTVVVRMNRETLVEGLGHARIDGIDQPISAATARRMSADAELIPAVFDGDGLPLDLGRAARLFSRAQGLALGERDGGCASCGQNIGYVEAHHIRWWERDAGPTDLANGVMLCSFCHHRVHRELRHVEAA